MQFLGRSVAQDRTIQTLTHIAEVCACICTGAHYIYIYNNKTLTLTHIAEGRFFIMVL